jgi:hypothetical protein
MSNHVRVSVNMDCNYKEDIQIKSGVRIKNGVN